ncbi:MAG TPA: hypothetical protein ENO18_00470 [Caldithrix sp.]|nr:hypothetical protein [Caldithrix sp.]
MQKLFSLAFIILVICLLLPIKNFAQVTDSTQVSPTFAEDEIISLEAQEIKITIEKPQVTIISDRIKPEFDDVHLDKSFVSEITGEGEKFIFKVENKFEARQRIDVDKLVKKTR